MLGFSSYLQLQLFNQQQFRADGMLMPHLQQALFVSGNFWATVQTQTLVQEIDSKL